MPAGRPSKLTPELQAKIVSAIEAGNYKETAAQAAGVTDVSLWRWLKDPRHAEFCSAVKAAEATAERNALAIVMAMPERWQALAWFLERRFPTKYGRRDPDHKLKKKALQVEVETLKAKLKMLEAGQNPDAQQITVVIPETLKREGE